MALWLFIFDLLLIIFDWNLFDFILFFINNGCVYSAMRSLCIEQKKAQLISELRFFGFFRKPIENTLTYVI